MGNDLELIRIVGIALAVILSLPLVLAIIRVVRFLSSIEQTAKSTSEKLDKWVSKVDDILDNHEILLREHDRDIAIIKDRADWNGEDERRKGGDRRHA